MPIQGKENSGQTRQGFLNFTFSNPHQSFIMEFLSLTTLFSCVSNVSFHKSIFFGLHYSVWG